MAQIPDLDLNSKISASTSKSTSVKNQKPQKKSKNAKTNISIASESSNNTTIDVKTPKDSKKSKQKQKKSAKKTYDRKKYSSKHKNTNNNDDDDDQSEISYRSNNSKNGSLISKRSSRVSESIREYSRSDNRKNSRNHKLCQNSNSNFRRSNLFTVHEVDDSIQTIIRSNLASKNMGSAKFHTFNEINQVHSIIWLLYKSDLSFTQFGPCGVFDFVNYDDFKGVNRVNCKDLILDDEDENQMVDEKLALLTGPYYLNSQSQVEDASSFCTSQIHELELMEFEEFEPDQQSTVLFWKFIDLFINSGDRKVKNSDIAKIFTDYFVNFHGESQAIIAIQEICPHEIEARALEFLLAAKYKQSLRHFNENSDFIHTFCLSGCMDIREKCLKNTHLANEHSNFLDTLKMYSATLSHTGKYLLPMIFSFISGVMLSEIGLKRAEIVLQYWPLIISLMLLFAEEYSACTITNCLNQMINSLSQCNMPITSQLCTLIMNTCFKLEYERNFESLVQQMLIFRFDVDKGSKVSNYPIAFQYTDMLAKVMKKHWIDQNNINTSKITLKALASAQMAITIKLHKHGRLLKAFEYIRAIVNSYDNSENQFIKDTKFVSLLWSIIDIGFILVSMSQIEANFSQDEKQKVIEDLKWLSSLQNINNKLPQILSKQEFVEKEVEKNDVEELNEQPNSLNEIPNPTNSLNLQPVQTIESPSPIFNNPLPINTPNEPQMQNSQILPHESHVDQQNALDSFFNDSHIQNSFQIDSPGDNPIGVATPPNFLQDPAINEEDNRNEQVKKFYESRKPFQPSPNNDNKNSKNQSGTGGGLMGKMFGSIGRKLSATSLGNSTHATQPAKIIEEKPAIDLNAPPPAMDLVNMGEVQNLDPNKGPGDELAGAYVNIFSI